MPRLVTIKAGAYNVELANGISYNATHAATTDGPQVILTDEEFAKTVADGTTVADLGNVGTSVVTTQAAHTTDSATTLTLSTTYANDTVALAAAVNGLRTSLNALLAALQVAGGPQASS